MLSASLFERRGWSFRSTTVVVSHRNSLLLQTLDSQWVVHEVDEARAYGIPIICVVDVDKQTQREVIDLCMEKGFGTSHHLVSDSNVVTFMITLQDGFSTPKLSHSRLKKEMLASIV